MNKNKIIIAVAIIVGVLGISVHAADTALKRRENYNKTTGSYNLVKDPASYFKEKKVANTKDVPKSTVPVYEGKSLLEDTDGCFHLGRDAGFYNGSNTRLDYTSKILTAYPSDAVRETEAGYYTMHDTDTGLRLYLFFSENNKYSTLSGFPIIMKKKLSYDSFRNIKVGDSINKVQKVDPIIEEYIKSFDLASDTALKNYTSIGAGATSIHLLNDGILKIEYARVNQSYVITNMTYSEDFSLDCFAGNISYKINSSDYVSE